VFACDCGNLLTGGKQGSVNSDRLSIEARLTRSLRMIGMIVTKAAAIAYEETVGFPVDTGFDPLYLAIAATGDGGTTEATMWTD
jgi:hypothetical protein